MSQNPMASPEEHAPEKHAPIPIKINGIELDPNKPAVRALGLGVGNAAGSNHVLIQTKDYLSKENKEAFEKLKVEPEELVSEKTYLCRFEPDDLDEVRKLDFVTWAGVYGSQFVVAPDLRPGSSAATSAATQSSSQAHEVDVVFHGDPGESKDTLIKAVVKAAHVHQEAIHDENDKIRLVLQDTYLNDVARLDAVRAILPVVQKKLFNEVARSILMGQGDIATERDLMKGELALRGDGEIICVADTGIDVHHAAFRSRVLPPRAWGRNADNSTSERTDDPDGHGTHVSGSVLGDGTYHKSDTEIVHVQGTAPGARLLMQSLLDDSGGLGGIPADVSNLFEEARKAGARVHTNSWGPTQAGLPYSYENAGSQIDSFIKKNPEMVICFAAGNEGIDRDRNGIVDFKQIGMYAAAKNSITVGASESYRPEQRLAYGRFDYQAGPLRSDVTANNSMGMAAFSNRGPSREGRIKPDIVAPGTCILSAKSSLALAGTTWGRSNDPSWMYEGGTSMACPLVAGGCALIRQALRTQKPDPSAALVKALLINGAVELKGQYLPSEAGPSPNFSSGWGRVNLSESIAMATYASDDDETALGCMEGTALADGGSFSRTVDISSEGKTLKVTLVWTDLPGDLLQNDLALSVKVGDVERQGNPTPDRKNNVEQIVWSAIPAKKAIITVRVKHLVQIRGFQDYALAWKLS